MIGAASWIAYIAWPRKLILHPQAFLPTPKFLNGSLILRAPLGGVLAQAGSFHNELAAYLNFEYLRSLKEVNAAKVFLSIKETNDGPEYQIWLLLARISHRKHPPVECLKRK
jgi:hypothetical protein